MISEPKIGSHTRCNSVLFLPPPLLNSFDSVLLLVVPLLDRALLLVLVLELCGPPSSFPSGSATAHVDLLRPSPQSSCARLVSAGRRPIWPRPPCPGRMPSRFGRARPAQADVAPHRWWPTLSVAGRIWPLPLLRGHAPWDPLRLSQDLFAMLDLL
jgi:hypothetical protein